MPIAQSTQETVEVPKLRFIESLVDVPTDMGRQVSMIVQRHVPAVRAGPKVVWDAQTQFMMKISVGQQSHTHIDVRSLDRFADVTDTTFLES